MQMHRKKLGTTSDQAVPMQSGQISQGPLSTKLNAGPHHLAASSVEYLQCCELCPRRPEYAEMDVRICPRSDDTPAEEAR